MSTVIRPENAPGLVITNATSQVGEAITSNLPVQVDGSLGIRGFGLVRFGGITPDGIEPSLAETLNVGNLPPRRLDSGAIEPGKTIITSPYDSVTRHVERRIITSGDGEQIVQIGENRYVVLHIDDEPPARAMQRTHAIATAETVIPDDTFSAFFPTGRRVNRLDIGSERQQEDFLGDLLLAAGQASSAARYLFHTLREAPVSKNSQQRIVTNLADLASLLEPEQTPSSTAATPVTMIDMDLFIQHLTGATVQIERTELNETQTIIRLTDLELPGQVLEVRRSGDEQLSLVYQRDAIIAAQIVISDAETIVVQLGERNATIENVSRQTHLPNLLKSFGAVVDTLPEGTPTSINPKIAAYEFIADPSQTGSSQISMLESVRYLHENVEASEEFAPVLDELSGIIRSLLDNHIRLSLQTELTGRAKNQQAYDTGDNQPGATQQASEIVNEVIDVLGIFATPGRMGGMFISADRRENRLLIRIMKESPFKKPGQEIHGVRILFTPSPEFIGTGTHDAAERSFITFSPITMTYTGRTDSGYPVINTMDERGIQLYRDDARPRDISAVVRINSNIAPTGIDRYMGVGLSEIPTADFVRLGQTLYDLHGLLRTRYPYVKTAQRENADDRVRELQTSVTRQEQGTLRYDIVRIIDALQSRITQHGSLASQWLASLQAMQYLLESFTIDGQTPSVLTIDLARLAHNGNPDIITITNPAVVAFLYERVTAAVQLLDTQGRLVTPNRYEQALTFIHDLSQIVEGDRQQARLPIKELFFQDIGERTNGAVRVEDVEGRKVLRITYRKQEFSIELPSDNRTVIKGGVARLVLKLMAGIATNRDLDYLIERELPINDIDVITLDPHGDYVTKLGITPDNTETVYGDALNLEELIAGRDVDLNCVFVTNTGFVYTQQALEAAQTGHIRNVAFNRGLFGTEVFPVYLRHGQFNQRHMVMTPRGMARMMKLVVERKAVNFDFIPLNREIDMGIQWLVLARRLLAKGDRKLLERAYYLGKQMGQVRDGENNIFDVLQRVHRQYPFFIFDSEPMDDAGKEGWLLGKLFNQTRRKLRRIIGDQFSAGLYPTDVNTTPYTVSLDGYTNDPMNNKDFALARQTFLEACAQRNRGAIIQSGVALDAIDAGEDALN